MLYMFGAVDTQGYSGACASKGQYYLRKAMSELYKPGYDMFSGDEDNGQMSAWYILSSLGLYSLSPASTDYVFGSPLFSKAVVHLNDYFYNKNSHGYSRKINPTRGSKLFQSASTEDVTLTIIAKNNGPMNVYVQNIYWNGQLLDNSKRTKTSSGMAALNSIPYAELMKGGELTFEMSDKPSSNK